MTGPEIGAGLDQVTAAASERRPAIVAAIESARSKVRLSMFRCTDFKVLDKLAEALQRGVSVELLLTRRAKGWEKKIREIGAYLESMGAQVHRYAPPGIKYHAKYLVVDDTAALISSANLTLECFEKTSDFLVLTRDPAVVSSLTQLFEMDVASPGSALPSGLSQRLIIGPELSRTGFRRLIGGARRSLRIVDHRVKDPDMLALLRERERAGVEIQVFGKRSIPGLKSHGKMMIIDGTRAVLGSISLSPPGLGRRRELSVVIDDAGCVAAFDRFLEPAGFGLPLAALKGASAAAVADLAGDGDDDDESEEEE
jgi:cardiolipin synthase A/B